MRQILLYVNDISKTANTAKLMIVKIKYSNLIAENNMHSS